MVRVFSLSGSWGDHFFHFAGRMFSFLFSCPLRANRVFKAPLTIDYSSDFVSSATRFSFPYLVFLSRVRSLSSYLIPWTGGNGNGILYWSPMLDQIEFSATTRPCELNFFRILSLGANKKSSLLVNLWPFQELTRTLEYVIVNEKIKDLSIMVRWKKGTLRM